MFVVSRVKIGLEFGDWVNLEKDLDIISIYIMIGVIGVIRYTYLYI